MLESMFRGLFDSDLTAVISVPDFLLCLGTALVLGLLMAFAYLFRARYTRSFVVTLALLPAVVCVVIMMVNGNVEPVWQWRAHSALFVFAPCRARQRRSACCFSPWEQG